MCLKRGVKIIVLLTMPPPIPKIAGTAQSIDRYRAFNEAITSCHYGKKVHVLDICLLFVAGNSINMDLYARFTSVTEGHKTLMYSESEIHMQYMKLIFHVKITHHKMVLLCAYTYSLPKSPK